MFLKTPWLTGMDEKRLGNRLRHLARLGETAEGELTPFKLDRIEARRFVWGDSTREILLVPDGTEAAKIPSRYGEVLACSKTTEGHLLDASSGSWLRSPLLNDSLTRARIHSGVLDSWVDAFSYAAENKEDGGVGLRTPQLGALHAIHAHWSTSDATATIVMPTGTGKTETMLAVLTSARCRRVLVVVPTDALRSQLALKFLTLGILKAPKSRILSAGALLPVVCTLLRTPRTVSEVNALFADTHVIVTTSHIAARASREVQDAMADQCTHLFIDEAHHAEAPTWRAFRTRFRRCKVLQFTATPFREDGQPLDGTIAYAYPLRRAQEEGYFKPIRFRRVMAFNPSRADEEIAKTAIQQLRHDMTKGHILMARVNSVDRARAVAKLYRKLAPDIKLEELHTGIKGTARRREAREAITSGRARIVVCVDMLGEGFDLPELKIAAFHDIRKTLAVTLQLAGRFTRTRPDLGEATFVANTADIDVQDELRKLYARDPDWNTLLPDISDALVRDQQTLQEFLAGFTDFGNEIPLAAVRPALSTVVYRTKCDAWRVDTLPSGIPNLATCEQVHHAANEKERTAVVVVARRKGIAWVELDTLHSWEWELYVLYWWKERDLLFIHSSTNAGVFKALAETIAGSDATLVKGQDVFRVFDGVKRLRLNNAGLSEQLGRNVSFTSRMGSDVATVLADAQRRKVSKSILAGGGFEEGRSITIAASKNGRIWTHRRGQLTQLVAWCRHIGEKLIDSTLDPDAVLRGTLCPEIVDTPPTDTAVAIDWPEEIYRSDELRWSFRAKKNSEHISEVDIALVKKEINGQVFFSISSETVNGTFALKFLSSASGFSDFQVQQLEEPTLNIVRSDTERAAAEFFTENPPRIWYADGACLVGNEYTPLRTTLPPYSPEKIASDWDWSGVDLKVESQGVTKKANSIQRRTISILQKRGYDVIFDDDGSGEAADVVAISTVGDSEAPESIEVEFYHCKYSQSSEPGARIADLYEVCGQAQSSVRWMSSGEKQTDLFSHLLRRNERQLEKSASSRVEVGSAATIETLREMSRTTPVRLKVVVVQPGVSKKAISNAQLRLLSVTENYLMETYQVPFLVVTSQ